MDARVQDELLPSRTVKPCGPVPSTLGSSSPRWLASDGG